MILKLLKRIKKLKIKDLKEVARRIEIVSKRQSTIFEDLKEVLNCCDYHFDGGNYHYELCSCDCLCKNCEWIPTEEVPLRMQEIAKDLTEENVFNEFIEKYCEKKEEHFRQSDQASNTNDTRANS